MKPSRVTSKLRQIATALDNSKNPRRDLVAADLKKLITAVEEGGGLSHEQTQEFRKFWDKVGQKLETAHSDVSGANNWLGDFPALDRGKAVPELEDALQTATTALKKVLDVANELQQVRRD